MKNSNQVTGGVKCEHEGGGTICPGLLRCPPELRNLCAMAYSGMVMNQLPQVKENASEQPLIGEATLKAAKLEPGYQG